MISALLLPLLFTGAPAQPAAATRDDPPIRIWISNDRRFLPGDRATVEVRTEYDGYLIVFHVDPEGRLRVLFPLDPDEDSFARSGKKYEVRGRGGRESFDADATGRGTVYGAVSRDPFRFDEFTLADHWDYRALAPNRLGSDPEAELNELVRRMARSSFDYDLLTYEVIPRSAYASSYSSSYRYDDWCGFSCGHSYHRGSPYSLSIGFFYGAPYRRYYYDPYYYAYSPFYNPFFYDPYYYAPAYYPHYAYPSRYYGYYDPYYYNRYGNRYGTYNRPYTPYRFRGSTATTDAYRGRGYDIRRSVNTVYNPPFSRVREPAATGTVRRVIGEGSVAELPSRVAPRRWVTNETQVRPQIDARRAREPETSRRPAPTEARRTPQREVAPSRGAKARDERPREQPRAERAREEPRQVERAPAPEARPQRREVERSSAPPPQVRSQGRAESRGSGGGNRSDGGSRQSAGGGSRRR